MRRQLALLAACVTLSGCGLGKEIAVDGPTGLTVSTRDSIFPPGASKVRKEKQSWYSFDRNGKRFLLYYPGDADAIQIFEE